MGKPTICIVETKGTDQLRSNFEADQRLCLRYMDIILPLLHKSETSSLYPSSVTVQPGLCRTWSEPKLLDISRTGSIDISVAHLFLDGLYVDQVPLLQLAASSSIVPGQGISSRCKQIARTATWTLHPAPRAPPGSV